MEETATLRRARASQAAVAVARRYGLEDCRPIVLQDWNNTIVHLAPASVVAKVSTSPLGQAGSRALTRELAVALHLAAAGAPVVPPSSELPPGPHRHAGTELTFWTLCAHGSGEIDPVEAGETLRATHEALATYAGTLPRFTDQLTEVRGVLDDPSALRALAAQDRQFLKLMLDELEGRLGRVTFELRPLHGEAHLGNVLKTPSGLLWLDFESACLGPLEWDLSMLPLEALAAFASVDEPLLALLRRLRSLCVAVWCWVQPERAPEVREAAEFHLASLRG